MAVRDQAHRLRELLKNGYSRRAKVLTIASGKGGVGKSNISLNLGIALTRFGKQVLLFDADVGLANLHILMGMVPKYNISHVVNGQKMLDEVVQRTEYGIDLIAGASGILQLVNMDETSRAHLQESLKRLETFYDYIIMDAGAGASENVISFCRMADEIIVVTNPETTAIADAYGFIKVISQIDPEAKIKLIINRVRSNVEGLKAAKKIINTAAQFLNFKIEELGFIFEDPAVQDAVAKQVPFVVAYPRSKASSYVFLIARRLEEHQNVKKPGRGLFSWLFGE